MTKRLLAALSVSVVCSSCTSCVPYGDANPGARSGVLILVDFSRSFTPLTAHDRRTLSILGQAAQRLAQRGEQPVKIQWGAITDESKRAPKLCGGPRMFQQTFTTLRRTPEEYVTNAKDLNRWAAEVCPDAIVATSQATPTPFTDITGAVSLAIDSMNAVVGQRFLFVFSDFLEDRPQPTVASVGNLSGYRVLLAWRAGVDSLRDIDSRLEQWRTRFQQAGAHVCVQPVVSLTPDDIVACVTRSRVAEQRP